MARGKDLHARWDHADRTARITRCRWASSKSPPARITTSPITTSMVPTDLLSTFIAGSRAQRRCPSRASRRQLNSCDGCIPRRCAIADTLAPGSIAYRFSYRRSLNSSDQRRNCRGAPSSRSGTASIMWKVLGSELGADIEAHCSRIHLPAIPDESPPPLDGVDYSLTVAQWLGRLGLRIQSYSHKKSPLSRALCLVAGAGFEPAAFRL